MEVAAIIYQSLGTAIGGAALLTVLGVGVTGVRAKDVALEGEVGMWWFQGIHIVGERLAQAVEVKLNLVIREGMIL